MTRSMVAMSKWITYQSDLKFLMLSAVATPAADVAGLVLPGGPPAAGAAPGCHDWRKSSKARHYPATTGWAR